MVVSIRITKVKFTISRKLDQIELFLSIQTKQNRIKFLIELYSTVAKKDFKSNTTLFK